MADTLWDKFKYFVLGRDDEDDFYEDEIEEEDEVEIKAIPKDRNIITDNIVRSTTKTNLVDLNSNNNMKVIVYTPQKYSDAEQIVKNLKEKKPVVVNLEDVEVELARKIFNFCSGAICALDGEMRKISKEIFILAPINVKLDGDKTKDTTTEEQIPFDWRK